MRGWLPTMSVSRSGPSGPRRLGRPGHDRRQARDPGGSDEAGDDPCGGGGLAAPAALPPLARAGTGSDDHFGRLFPSLLPFAEPSRKLTAALLEFGAPGGLLDARDDLAAGPAALILDPALSLNNPNNP